jgi:heme exporter protein A
MLVCDNIGCDYGSKQVFEGVGFTAGEGTLIVLHGHNGTGKTSLLHMLAGLRRPLTGSITWNGKEVGKAIRDSDLGVIFIGHEPMVKTELTVRENLNFWADLSGDRKSIPFALEKFGLEPYVNTKCDELSRGWQKRVVLSRLIFSPAELWVLDEPYNNLDHEIAKLLDSLIGEKKEIGGIIILSSHTYVPIESAIKLNIADYTPKTAGLAGVA